MEVLVIVGPTGVGKTKLSVALAHLLNGEIINADSTQVYKTLDIATAKIKEEEKEGIIHHLFDIKDITEDYTVYDYQKDCREKIKEIQSRGHLPILVGGTGLYIKAVLYDYQFEEEVKKEIVGETDDLYQKLLEVDPNTEIHPHNRKRIIRALQYYQNHQKPMSSKEKGCLLYDCMMVGLTTKRELLYERIDQRVDQMIEDGLLEEAKRIYDSNIRSKAVMTPIGYKELFSYFDGTSDLSGCIQQMKQNSRRYAKRQYTWFYNQLFVTWFDVDFHNFEKTIQDVLLCVKEKNV